MKRPETNKFTLNEEKNRKSDKHPTHRGVLDVNGQLYWIGGWYNDGQFGTWFKGDIREITPEEIAKYFGDEPKVALPSKPLRQAVLVDNSIEDELPF